MSSMVAPMRFLLLGTSFRVSISVGRRASSPSRAREKPRPPVELAWGSQSMRRVGRPSRAMAAAKLMAVVVLPTPPFWLTTAMTFDGVADDAVAAGWGLLTG